MLPFASALHPRENGQQASTHPAYLGEHIAMAVTSKWQPSAGDKVAVVSKQIVTYRDMHARITTAPQPNVTSQIVTNVTSRPTSLPRPNVDNVKKRDNHAAAAPASLPRPNVSSVNNVINVITLPPYHSARSHQHSALSPAPRNIKATSGWLWQEHDALAVIAGEYGVGERGRAARSVYFALTQVASKQRTPDRAHTSCAYLGTVALLGESAVRRYLHEFITLGLIDVIPGVHQANTYVLLAVGGTDRLATGAMSLADGAGESLAITSEVGSYSERAAAGDTPTLPQQKARAAAADSPTVAAFSTRATAGASQIRRKDSKKKATNTSAAGAAANCANDFHAENPATPTSNIGVQIPLAGTLPLTSEQQAAATSLIGIGVRRTVAQAIAATCNPDDIRGWVRYAIRTGGLKSRAGFVLSMLRLGEAPPDAAAEYHLPSFKPPAASGDEHQNASADIIAAPEGVERLTVASVLGIADPGLQIADCRLQNEDSPDTDTGDNTQHEATSTQHSALWLAAREELARRITGSAWGLWLKHVRLLAVEGDTWRLSRPSCGVTGSFERRHAAEIAAVLADLNGQDVRLEWVEAGRELVD